MTSTLFNASLDSVPQETWEKLLGSTDWDGLLEPDDLDINLRKFILRCGYFCQAAYDAFANSKSDREAISEGDVNVPDGYEVHASLHATTNLSLGEKFLDRFKAIFRGEYVPHWMGYCAVTKNVVGRDIKRREIYIAWRGTKRLFEWKNNFFFVKKSAKFLLHDFDNRNEDKPRIMKGWRSIYTSTYRDESSSAKTCARDELRAKVKELLKKYKNQGEQISIVLTGHSLGGVLATLGAFDLVENKIVDKETPVVAVVFGCPKIGNEAFKQRVERHGNLKILHVRNRKDLVPYLPLGVFHKYVRIGSELAINTDKSPNPSLSESKNPSVWHDLKATLHMVEGWSGPDKPFKQRVRMGTDQLMQPTESFQYFDSNQIELWKKRSKRFTEYKGVIGLLDEE